MTIKKPRLSNPPSSGHFPSLFIPYIYSAQPGARGIVRRESNVRRKGHGPRWPQTSEAAFCHPPSLSGEAFQSSLSLRSQPSRPTSRMQAEKLLTSRFRSILARLLPTNRNNLTPGTRTATPEPELPSGLAQASGNLILRAEEGLEPLTIESERQARAAVRLWPL